MTSRELRNNTAGVLWRVQAGEQATITVNGKPVAVLKPLQQPDRSWVRREDLVSRLSRVRTDPGLRADLARLADGTTDDLGPIR